MAGKSLGHFLELIPDQELPDIIISATPPLTANNYLSRWAKKKRIPLVLDIQDAWPAPFAQAFPWKPMANMVLGPLYRMASANIRNAAAVVSMSQDLLDFHRKDIGDKPIKVFHLGIDTSRFPDVHSADAGPVRIVYMGSAQANLLHEIIDAGGKTEGTELHIIGSGADTDALRKYAADRDYTNIFLTPWMEFGTLTAFLSTCHLGLLWPPAGAKIAFPNKAFAYLAAGLPIISNLQGGELERTLEMYNLGITASPDVEGLKRGIQDAISRFAIQDRIRIQQFAREYYDAEGIYREYCAWVRGIWS